MATYTFTNANGDQNLPTLSNWTPTPTNMSGQAMRFDSSAAFTGSNVTWNWLALTVTGAIRIDNSYPATTINSSYTGSRSFNNTTPLIDGYTIYVGDNKAFDCPPYNWLNSDLYSPSAIYVGSNGLLYRNVANGFDRGTSTDLSKYGPGVWRAGPNGTDTSTLRSVTIREGIVQAGFSSATNNPFGRLGAAPYTYAPVYFNGTGVELQFGFFGALNSFTIPNQLVFTSGGIVKSLPGFSATLSSSPGGSGTITIGNGGGSLTWSATIGNNVSVDAGATLTMGAGSGITGTLTGTGTIAMNGGTLSGNSPAFAGTITGNFNFSGGINTLAASSITGTVTPTGGALTLAGSGTGFVGDLGYVTFYLTGNLSGAGGTTSLTGTGGGSAYFGIDGASAGIAASRTVAMRNGSSLALFNGASFAGPITSTADTTTSTLVAASASSCTLSGNFSTNQASGLIVVEAAVGGTLTLGGSLSSSNAGRTFALNEDTTHSPPARATVNIGGTIKLTGSGFSGSPATLKRGTLYLNSTSSVGVGTTLTVSGSGTTVACSSTGPYAAQITGNMSFGAGTVLRFGAPA